MDENELVSVRVHFLHCVYGKSEEELTDEIMEPFLIEENNGLQDYKNDQFFTYGENGFVKFFDENSLFSPFNKLFNRSKLGKYCCCDIDYYDTDIPICEVKKLQNKIEKRRNELCLM